ncbi:MAG: alpha/beta hydrolase, partial [Muribaculaceae bacterium]|nr:alpha/beta hydrolase [Muribaculaceae bacterium]
VTAMNFPKDTFDSMIVFYPVIKAFPDNSSSWNDYGVGFGLDSELMEAFNESYTSDIFNPMVSPAFAVDDDLKFLPATIVIAADRDILKDQGYEFAQRIKRIGVEVEYQVIPGSVHLFITVPGQPSAFNYSVTHTSEFISTHKSDSH